MIELKHLKTLNALSQHGSLAAAAPHLYQTQSALSHQFSDLEHRLGFKLFVRNSQPLRFTEQGEILLHLAKQILPIVKDAIRICNEPSVSALRIAIECHSCIQWLTPALKKFKEQWPKVSFDFKSGVIFEPQPELLSRELDIVITSDILVDQKIHYAPLFDYEVKLIVAYDHPLAKNLIIKPDDLSNETLLIYPVHRQRFDVWRHFLNPAGVSPNVKTVDNTLLLIQMVTAKMGVAALPHWVVDSFETQRLIITKTLGNGLWSRLYAACRDGEQHQPTIKHFTQTTTNHAVNNLSYVKPTQKYPTSIHQEIYKNST
ncbi:HTH-type transcriptional regulator MetR [Candidatus Hartigia pinicola]|nr:HTH-type transcriptional regulator MetR [Candidatus Hartigia pinicola]